METVKDFILLGSKITADGDCSHENKRFLILGRKVMTDLDRVLKSRDITWPTKIHIVKADLKLNIQKTKIMASGLITSWQIDGETMETVIDFSVLGSKITADSDCSHKIKRCLLLGNKAMTNLDSILKSRDIILPMKVHLVKAMVFPVVMYRGKSWTIKKAES